MKSADTLNGGATNTSVHVFFVFSVLKAVADVLESVLCLFLFVCEVVPFVVFCFFVSFGGSSSLLSWEGAGFLCFSDLCLLLLPFTSSSLFFCFFEELDFVVLSSFAIFYQRRRGSSNSTTTRTKVPLNSRPVLGPPGRRISGAWYSGHMPAAERNVRRSGK